MKVEGMAILWSVPFNSTLLLVHAVAVDVSRMSLMHFRGDPTTTFVAGLLSNALCHEIYDVISNANSDVISNANSDAISNAISNAHSIEVHAALHR